MNWQALGDETVGARFLEGVLRRDSIASETVENLREGVRCHTETRLEMAAA
jgi:hypothetical protein